MGCKWHEVTISRGCAWGIGSWWWETSLGFSMDWLKGKAKESNLFPRTYICIWASCWHSLKQLVATDLEDWAHAWFFHLTMAVLFLPHQSTSNAMEIQRVSCSTRFTSIPKPWDPWNPQTSALPADPKGGWPPKLCSGAFRGSFQTMVRWPGLSGLQPLERLPWRRPWWPCWPWAVHCFLETMVNCYLCLYIIIYIFILRNRS